METGQQFMMESDKIQSQIEKTRGSRNYLLNPFQAVSPMFREICVLLKMNQPQKMMTYKGKVLQC